MLHGGKTEGVIENPGSAKKFRHAGNQVEPAFVFCDGITTINIGARGFEKFRVGMKGGIENLAAAFLGQGNGVCEKNQAVGQPSGAQRDDDFFAMGHAWSIKNLSDAMILGEDCAASRKLFVCRCRLKNSRLTKCKRPGKRPITFIICMATRKFFGRRLFTASARCLKKLN